MNYTLIKVLHTQKLHAHTLHININYTNTNVTHIETHKYELCTQILQTQASKALQAYLVAHKGLF